MTLYTTLIKSLGGTAIVFVLTLNRKNQRNYNTIQVGEPKYASHFF